MGINNVFSRQAPKVTNVNASTVVGLTGIGKHRAVAALPNTTLNQIMLQLQQGEQSISEISNACRIPINIVEMTVQRNMPVVFEVVDSMSVK